MNSYSSVHTAILIMSKFKYSSEAPHQYQAYLKDCSNPQFSFINILINKMTHIKIIFLKMYVDVNPLKIPRTFIWACNLSLVSTPNKQIQESQSSTLEKKPTKWTQRTPHNTTTQKTYSSATVFLLLLIPYGLFFLVLPFKLHTS